MADNGDSNKPHGIGHTPGGIPLLRIKDDSKQLPTYNAAQQRSVDEPLAAEDLNKMQQELETLLSSVSLRARVLKSELDNIDNDDKRNDRRNKNKQPLSPAPGNSGMAAAIGGIGGTSGVVNLNGKRNRDESAAVRKKHSSKTVLKQTKLNKNSPQAIQTVDSLDDIATSEAATVGANAYMNADTTAQATTGAGVAINNDGAFGDQQPKMTMPKNDMPNKFWLSIDPYCEELTDDDLCLIDDLLKQYKEPLVPPMPPLGQHYSITWANDDMNELQKKSNATSNHLKPHNKNTTGNQATVSSAESILKKADGMLDECITGPLTQRLVSALIDEQMIAHPSEQAAVDEHSNSSSSNENIHASSARTTPHNRFRTLSMLKNCVGIENRVKKELIEQGILNMADFPHNDEDEVMDEIKRVSAEISAVAHYNINELKKLRAATENEIKRVELKQKLRIIDQEILEWYKRLLEYHGKRKNFTIEDQQEVYRLTSEQRSLAEQLERMKPQLLQL